MPMVGGARAGIGGVRLADGNSAGNEGNGNCGCFPTVAFAHQTVTRTDALDAIDVTGLATDEEWVYWVNSVGRPYRLDRSALAATLTVDNIAVLSVTGEANSRWVALQWQNIDFWQTVDWYIDPGNSTGVADDENPGTLLLPLKSTAEYRRRVFGVNYTTALVGVGAAVNIHFLSASAVTDDGNFSGITGTAIIFNIIGIPVKIGATGSFTSAPTPITGNGRYLVTDALVNWTANGWVSTATSPKLIRNVAKTKHAFVLTDQTGGVASLSQPTDASETAGFSNNNVNFANGESYEVCTLPTLPTIQTTLNGGITIVVRCMKITNGPVTAGGTLLGVLAGFTPASALAWVQEGTTPAYFNCFFGGGVQSFYNIPIFKTCVAFGASMQFFHTLDNASNTLQLQAAAIVGNGIAGTIGTVIAWDCTSPAITGRYASHFAIEGMTGTGNTSKLIDCAQGSVVIGASLATAATTDTTPFRVNGIASATLPMVDGVAGGAIYL